MVILIGASTLLLACILAPISPDVLPLGISLFLLGLGWNFCFVGGSALLADQLSPLERSRTQGTSDLLVGLASAVISLSSGFIFVAAGYTVIAIIAGALGAGATNHVAGVFAKEVCCGRDGIISLLLNYNKHPANFAGCFVPYYTLTQPSPNRRGGLFNFDLICGGQAGKSRRACHDQDGFFTILQRKRNINSLVCVQRDIGHSGGITFEYETQAIRLWEDVFDTSQNPAGTQPPSSASKSDW